MKRNILTIATILAISTSSMAATANLTNDKPYTVSVTKIKNTSTFCIAIVKGDLEMVQKMIEMGADVNEFSNKKSPLMYAARYNRVEIAKLLLANGAKWKVKDPKGWNAATYAKQSNASDVASLLMEMKENK